jgi:hypothetical protein
MNHRWQYFWKRVRNAVGDNITHRARATQYDNNCSESYLVRLTNDTLKGVNSVRVELSKALGHSP